MAELVRKDVCGAATVALWLAEATAGAAGVAAASKTHVVEIENMRFGPQTLTVKVGDRITWINKDLVPHTATAASGGKMFDSRSIASNASWTLVADKAGRYTYVCALHPTMTGILTVE